MFLLIPLPLGLEDDAKIHDYPLQELSSPKQEARLHGDVCNSVSSNSVRMILATLVFLALQSSLPYRSVILSSHL